MKPKKDHLCRLSGLQGDELDIARFLLDRLRQGRATYGSWKVDDGRDYPGEALAEVIDALHYCAAELVRLRRNRLNSRVSGVKSIDEDMN